MKKSMLINELNTLIDPKPSDFQLDEDEDEITRAKVVDNFSENDEDENHTSFGSLRKRTCPQSIQEDERYEGRVTHRRHISSDVDELSEDDYLADDDVEEQGADQKSTDSEESEQDSDRMEDEHSDDIDPEGESEEEQNAANSKNDSSLVRTFAHVNLQDEYSKAKAVQAQLKIWEQLLAARIRLQRVTSLVNRMPQGADSLDAFLQPCKSDESEVNSSLKSCKMRLKAVLDQLVAFQNRLSLNCEGGASLFDSTTAQHAVDSDEEILSSPDEGDDDDDNRSKNDEEAASSTKLKPPSAKMYKLSEYPDVLAKRRLDFNVYRDKVLLHWYEKTKLASGKVGGKNDFSAFEKNVMQQIKQVLSDEKRLVRRTQLKRSNYEILGKRPRNADSDDEHDEEIFDDDDFYHQLLREIIERKSVGITDPHALGRQWLEVQKLRNKAKKKLVDRKASKARKIRYDVIQKLTNFMAPVDKNVLPYESRQELFKSLFGSS